MQASVRELGLPTPLHLGRTLGPLRQGRLDPTMQIDGDEAWRATRTPDGPVTTLLRVDPAAGVLRARAWGPGHRWALEHLPDLVGAGDDGDALLRLPRPASAARRRADQVVRSLAARLPGLRLPKSRAVAETLVPVVLAQKVTGLEARRSYRQLLAALGEPAPGPGVARGLLVPPAAPVLADTPSWVWHGFGVERQRAETIRGALRAHGRLEQAVGLPLAAARQRLLALPGVGPWTAAEIALVALGDPDAVSVRDYHLPNQVAWALAGEPWGDDDRMLELLEPYRGHRGRVLRLIVAGGVLAPRYGPRVAVTSFRHR